MNEQWKKISSQWIENFKNEKQRNKIILIFGVIGLILIMISEILPEENQKISENIVNQNTENEVYVKNMEKKLISLVENVSGAGKSDVMITLEQGIEYVYASESKKVIDETQSRDGENNSKIQQKDNSEKKIVVLEENGVNRPLVQTSREPQIKGVVVVCEGGNSSVVKARITEVLTIVLGIGSNQVCVVPRK